MPAHGEDPHSPPEVPASNPHVSSMPDHSDGGKLVLLGVWTVLARNLATRPQSR
jgi:hypothetical protein